MLRTFAPPDLSFRTSSHFVAEVQRITAALLQLALLSPLMAVSLFMPKAAQPEAAAGPGTEDENSPMNQIAKNTEKSANHLEEIEKLLRRMGRGGGAKIRKRESGVDVGLDAV